MRVALFFLSLALLSAPALAIPPAILTHYDLIPRRSTLLKTGGFAGVSERFSLIGDYDFLEDWESPNRPPALVPVASFVDPEIWGAQILPPGVFAPAIVIDVDELLNLEGLRGEPLPLGAPFDVYRFRGLIQDSAAASPLEQSSIDLFVAEVGPWQFLYGETTPPPGSADRFEYTIKALARRGSWADANDDGVVDAADYVLMREAEGLASSASLNGATIADWHAQLGETLPDMATMDLLQAAASSSAAIPEPAAVVLVLLGVTLARGTRRSGCRP